MNGLDIVVSILIIVLGVVCGLNSIVRSSRRGQSKFVALVLSLLFIIGGILALVYGFPVTEYLFD